MFNLTPMSQVLTHQFDQLKEEIIAKEMDLVKESQEKSRINREKDGLAKVSGRGALTYSLNSFSVCPIQLHLSH